MKDLSPSERQVVEATVSALLAQTTDPRDIQEIRTKFADLLRSNFENKNLWLRFGLTISLSKGSPQSALQAFKECIRIDQDDPLPAMLAAKLLLGDLDDPEQALDIANESISRCKKWPVGSSNSESDPRSESAGEPTKVTADPNYGDTSAPEVEASGDPVLNGNSLISPPENLVCSSSSNSSQSSISPKSKQQPTDKAQEQKQPAGTTDQDEPPGQPSCRYKNINPLLSKCYLLASIMHAQIYEREPESIKQFKTDHLRDSLGLLDMALEANPHDHLAYFHKALHQVKQRTYPKAIDNLRRAIQMSPRHIPSIQLLILTLSALKLNEEALVLCESALHEFEDNLLLLYFKCNLEQRLVGTKGYKTALSTAQYMLRSLRRSNEARDRNNNNLELNRNHSSTTTISVATQSLQNQQNQQQHQQQQQQQQPPSSNQNNLNPLQQQNDQNQQNHAQQQYNQAPDQISQQQRHHHQKTNSLTTTVVANSTISRNNSQLAVAASPKTTPVLTGPSKPGGDTKQMNNLFSDDAGERSKHCVIEGELSIWLHVAGIFVKIGSIEDAELCVDEAATHASGALSHKIMFVRGLIAKARNNLLEAKTFFQSCLALCPRHAMALQQVAHVYYQMGQYAIAEKFLRDSLDLDADCFKTWHYLSLVLTELSQPEKASECAKKSTVLEESSPVVSFSAIPRLTLN